MSSDWYRDVLEFNRKFAAWTEPRPEIPPDVVIHLRLKLIFEEAGELAEAMHDKRDLAGVADACADLIYVTLGAAQACGIDLRPVWDAVHSANMSKVGGGTREDGKILKPPDWKRPEFASILASQPSLSEVT